MFWAWILTSRSPNLKNQLLILFIGRSGTQEASHRLPVGSILYSYRPKLSHMDLVGVMFMILCVHVYVHTS